MGIASRTKWNYRLQHPSVKLLNGSTRPRMVDAAKLERRRALLPSVRQRISLMTAMRYERQVKAEKAAAKHAGHIMRRRKAAARRGFVPYAQR